MEKQRQATDKSIDPASFDPVRIAAIVRKVIARLAEPNRVTSDAPEISVKTVISVKTIEQHTGKHLLVSNSAVITPAARDEARLRGIRIERTNESRVKPTEPTTEIISDINNPQRAETIRQQLDRRGIDLNEINVVLTDSPALEVLRQISGGQRAAMVTEISDVDRFHSELSPTVWVLDMKRLNIPAAVNAAAKISQLAKIPQRAGTKR